MVDMDKLSKAQLGWLAGIIDGEGTICLHVHNRRSPPYYTPRIEVTNTDKPMLDTIAMWVGCGSVLERKVRGNRRKMWNWRIGGYIDTVTFLSKLFPYLVSKKERSKILLKFCVSKLLGEESNFESYYLRLKELNKRGKIL